MKAAADFPPTGLTEFADGNRGNARYAYLAQALGLLLFIFTLWFQVYLDLGDAAKQSRSAFLQSHRQWRLRSTFLFLVWSILSGFCVPFGFGILVFIPVWLWFLYRVSKGMAFFFLGKVI